MEYSTTRYSYMMLRMILTDTIELRKGFTVSTYLSKSQGQLKRSLLTGVRISIALDGEVEFRTEEC